MLPKKEKEVGEVQCCLHTMEYGIISRVNHFICKSTDIYLHHMTKNENKPANFEGDNIQ
jgi:hypothetical protein